MLGPSLVIAFAVLASEESPTVGERAPIYQRTTEPDRRAPRYFAVTLPSFGLWKSLVADLPVFPTVVTGVSMGGMTTTRRGVTVSIGGAFEYDWLNYNVRDFVGHEFKFGLESRVGKRTPDAFAYFAFGSSLGTYVLNERCNDGSKSCRFDVGRDPVRGGIVTANLGGGAQFRATDHVWIGGELEGELLTDLVESDVTFLACFELLTVVYF